MKLEWSAAALADRDRFAAFLQQRHRSLAAIAAPEIPARAQVLEAHPQLEYPIGRRAQYRQVVLEVLRAQYVFRYRGAGDRIVMLRVLRCARKPNSSSPRPP